jgi:hypothetical protein
MSQPAYDPQSSNQDLDCPGHKRLDPSETQNRLIPFFGLIPISNMDMQVIDAV